MKQCSHCNEVQHENAFVKSNRSKDGLAGDCKKCRKHWVDKWRKANPKHIKKYSRKWASDPAKREIRLANKKRYRQRHPERCREQVKAAAKKFRKKYARRAFDSWLRTRYGLTAKMFYRWSKKQNNLCAICKKKQLCNDRTKSRARLFVDHCHRTGKIRGLLCFKCNVMLGCARDDLKTLRNAINYLRK